MAERGYSDPDQYSPGDIIDYPANEVGVFHWRGEGEWDDFKSALKARGLFLIDTGAALEVEAS